MTRDPRSSIGSVPLELPAPPGEAAAHAERVARMLAARIDAAGGWLDFAQYMTLALYAPGLGYYSAGAAKFGAAGDFVTAPEISDLFAQVLADAFVPLFAAAGARRVLELGPGTGRFAGTVLRELAEQAALPEEYLLLEVGADLRERQPARVRELAGEAAARAHWLGSLPERFAGVVFGNEVLDALPCERFLLRGGEAWRLGVVRARSATPQAAPGFAWQARRADGSRDGDAAFVAALEPRLAPLRDALPEGYVGELQPAIGPWIAALGAMLERGAVLLADYGLPRRHYYHPQRVEGGLRAHYRHRAHDDPFLHPGLTDLSAWVDFTAVAEAADAADLEVAGFTTQAALLLGGGVEARLAAAMEGADEARRARLAHGARQLLLPGEMGEAVKVMLLTRGLGAQALPAGFSLLDLRGSL